MTPYPVKATGKLPPADRDAVQQAVDLVDEGGDVVLLQAGGAFNFGTDQVTVSRSVKITRSVNIKGEVINGVTPTINNGKVTFLINAIGMPVSIQGIRFVEPTLQAIKVTAVNGLTIASCKIELVKSALGPDGTFNTAQGILLLQGTDAISGLLSIKDNDIEVGAGTLTPKLGIDRTLGIVIVQVGATTGEVTATIAGNKIRTVTGFGIDLRDIIGSATIEGNDIAMASRGPNILVSGIRCACDTRIDTSFVAGTFTVRRNSIKCGPPRSAGIRLFSAFKTIQITGATIDENAIAMPSGKLSLTDDFSAGIQFRGNCGLNSASRNSISNAPLAGLSLVTGTSSEGSVLVPTQNKVAGNLFTSVTADPLLADIFVGEGVKDTQVSANLRNAEDFRASPASVLDLGTGTIIEGTETATA